MSLWPCVGPGRVSAVNRREYSMDLLTRADFHKLVVERPGSHSV